MNPNQNDPNYQPQSTNYQVASPLPLNQTSMTTPPQTSATFGQSMPEQSNSSTTVPTQNPNQPNQVKDDKTHQTNLNSTQNYLQIAEIREGIMIMKDGSFKAVVSCQSINFDLMSSREKEGIEYAYQGFLNSLYFPIQILVRSNKVDIGPYLERLIDIRSKQDNMLLNVLIDDYIRYIEILAQEANIMDKSFYVIIPYYQSSESLDDFKTQYKSAVSSGFSGLFAKKGTIQPIRISQKIYLKAKEEIQNRVDVITNGLNQVGVHAQQLNTEQLSQLFYNFYNPDISDREPLTNMNNIATIYTKKGVSQPGGEL